MIKNSIENFFSLHIEYWLFLNKSIWLLDETLAGTTHLRKRGSGSDGNEEILQTSQFSWTGASPLNKV